MLKTSSLITAYRFENNANDWSGGANNATVYGASAADGKLGRCYSFDGVDDYISFTPYTFEVGHSISMWIKFTANSNAKYFLGRASSTHGIRYNNTDFIVYMGVSGQTSLAWTNTNTMVFLCITHVSAKLYNFYINGAYIGQCDSNSNTSPSFQYFGRRSDGNYFNGLIDEVCFWNRTISVEGQKRIMLGLHPMR